MSSILTANNDIASRALGLAERVFPSPQEGNIVAEAVYEDALIGLANLLESGAVTITD